MVRMTPPFLAYVLLYVTSVRPGSVAEDDARCGGECRGEQLDLTEGKRRAAQGGHVEEGEGVQAAQIDVLGAQTPGVDLIGSAVDEGETGEGGTGQVEGGDLAGVDAHVDGLRRSEGQIVDAHAVQLELADTGVAEVEGADATA